MKTFFDHKRMMSVGAYKLCGRKHVSVVSAKVGNPFLLLFFPLQ